MRISIWLEAVLDLYGFGNSEKENKNLKPIASLKTVISQIHMIEKGKSVGYNRAFKSDAFLKTATLPIGHADGIGRQYGNGKVCNYTWKKSAHYWKCLYGYDYGKHNRYRL